MRASWFGKTEKTAKTARRQNGKKKIEKKHRSIDGRYAAVLPCRNAENEGDRGLKPMLCGL